jgi:uncharacterized phiE125 gp8 family phage protein
MLYVVTPPRSEPVTLSELRRWLAMTDDNDTAQDPEIWAIAKAMRAYAEKYTGRRFVDTALELNLDYWESRVIQLPVAPVVSIDYVKYIDSSGTLQTLYDDTTSPTVGASAIAIDLKSQPARISPPWAGFWPTIRGGDFNAVQIGFTAGYGTARLAAGSVRHPGRAQALAARAPGDALREPRGAHRRHGRQRDPARSQRRAPRSADPGAAHR